MASPGTTDGALPTCGGVRVVCSLSPPDRGRRGPGRHGGHPHHAGCDATGTRLCDGVVAGWSRADGLVHDLAGVGDEQWAHPVVIE